MFNKDVKTIPLGEEYSLQQTARKTVYPHKKKQRWTLTYTIYKIN